ncbi:hypothetical protein [Sulfurovum sp. NBC37-1]|uniref:hypothetical protein n=1 Tax=Sulfurovum sp. (strain NBC37-1) TaxID=387093 RepID=UPI0001587D62|nr:hypothetical protein [Sulfurovum sp. NBC37-1]BAF72626.1 hypothetical protein SUN_1676 [Sulfurovum sp. NBC37-1]
MNKLLLIFGLLMISLNANLSVDQIENMVVKIHKKRKGADLITLEKTKEPFVIRKEEKKIVFVPTKVSKTETKMSLHAIMNGKAYINDSWKSIDDKIFGYTVKYIGKRGVVLKNGNQVKKLFLHEKKNNFIKIVEGE